METRSEQQLILCVGKRHSGKTTMGLKFAQKSGKQVVVLNNGFHPNYSHWQHVTLEQLPYTTITENFVVPVDEENINEVCTCLLQYHKSLFIVFEDANKYIAQAISRGGVKSIIIDLRKRDFDLLFMYHALKLVPPFIAGMYNMLLLFKTTDSFDSSLKKFPNTGTIKQKGEKINKHKNQFYCDIIYDYE